MVSRVPCPSALAFPLTTLLPGLTAVPVANLRVHLGLDMSTWHCGLLRLSLRVPMASEAP